jgi:hypothetical protein
MKKILICVLSLCLCLCIQVQAQGFVSCFQSGNSDCLSAYLSDNVGLTVGNTEGVFSKAQSKVILQKFFTENNVKNFSILHQTGSDNAKNIIAQLATNNKSYRIYLLTKTINSKPIIQKIRIEND